jgi:hypothetical protein
MRTTSGLQPPPVVADQHAVLQTALVLLREALGDAARHLERGEAVPVHLVLSAAHLHQSPPHVPRGTRGGAQRAAVGAVRAKPAVHLRDLERLRVDNTLQVVVG